MVFYCTCKHMYIYNYMLSIITHLLEVYLQSMSKTCAFVHVSNRRKNLHPYGAIAATVGFVRLPHFDMHAHGHSLC